MNEVMIDLGFMVIKWYSFLILIGLIIGLIYVKLESKKFDLPWDFVFNMSFWTILVGFIGARLYYVIFNFSIYSSDPISIFKVWEGGLAIHGGIIAGFITMLLYCKKYNARILRMTDIFAVPLILGQAIGRWGNFFNGEAHGAATSLSTLEKLHIPNFIIEGMNIGGIYYQPTFLYESLWCLLGFIILLIIKRYKYLKVGQLTCVYLMFYSVGRFFIEAMRTDSLMLGGFKMAQIISIALFVIALLVFMVLSRKSKFEDLYRDKVNEQIRF